MRVALDSTYSLGRNLSGVGMYSREIMQGLARWHPESKFRFCYRPHRYLSSYSETLPANCSRCLLYEPFGPRRCDVFHGLNQRLPRMRFRRTVTTFHDLFVMTGEYSTPEFRSRFTEQALRAAQTSDHIIAVSAFTAGQVTGLLGVEPARVTVIPHGVRIQRYPEPSHRENMILHVGAIQLRKNIVRLVEAFESLDPGWELVLAGSCGFGSRQVLERIELSPRRSHIRVAGYVDDRRLAELYATARVFAFPSLDEGFGMPVLEAMAAGVPVVTSNRSALPEVAGDAAVLVDPEDAPALGEAIKRLVGDSELRSDLIQRGFKRAEGFTWSSAVEKTWKVYQRLL